MKPLTQSKNTTILPVLIVLALVCFALSPQARAVCQEDCLTNQNTAFGDNALVNLVSGVANTALGGIALEFNTDGHYNTAVGFGALEFNATGSENTAIGYGALPNNTTGQQNVAAGRSALYYNTTGSNNTAIAYSALEQNTIGRNNTGIGYSALRGNISGDANTAIGKGSLAHNNHGRNNVALGFEAGFNIGGDNNIAVGNPGVRDEGDTIRIGATQANTYIAGISGVTVPTGVAVIVDTDGHLGTTTSSARFKEKIQPMNNASEAVLDLKPVMFRYKKELDPKGTQQFGLVAEEVAKVNRDLVVADKQGKPYTVHYDAVNAMLLNEFLKARRQIDTQQKQIDALTAGLQKVSAQLEASKPAQQVVSNP
jgi:hypothetical protein